MSLIQPYMVANNSVGNDLTLSPLAGQSILVKAIYVSNTESGYATVETSKSTVGYYRIDSALGNQLSPPTRVITPGGSTYIRGRNIMHWLAANTSFQGYPVAEGETFRVTATWSANARVTAIYEVWNAGDQQPTNPNGSGASVYHVINYISVSGGVSAGGYALYNDQITPPQFPAFPSVGDVPSNNTIKLLGVLGWTIGTAGGTAGDTLATELVKMTRERTVLFDEDKLGLPNYGFVPTGTSVTYYGGGISVFGNLSNIDDSDPFVTPVDLVFQPGDTLRVEQSFAAAGTVPSLTADQVALGFIEEITVAAG